MADISVLIDVIGTEDMVKATKTADRMRKEYSRLDREFNKGNISAQQYAKGIQQVDFKVDQIIAGHKVSKVAINAHTQAVKGNTGALATNAMATQRATKSTKQFASIGLQQVGYQVSDFTVQVQNGTSALVAFGQQGSQLAGLLFLIPGFWGAVAGAVVSIAIPAFTAFANVLFNLGDGSKAVEKSVDGLTKSINDYKSSADRATKSSKDLRDMYGESASKARELFNINKTLAELDAIDALKESMITLRDQFGDFSDVSTSSLEDAMNTFDDLGDKINKAGQLSDSEFGRANQALRVYNNTVSDLENKLGSTRGEAFQFAVELSKLSQAEGPKEAADQLDVVRSLYFDIIGGTEGATDAQRELLRQLVNNAIEAMNLKVEIDDAKDSAESLADIAGDIDFSAASASARALADELGIALSLATRLDPLARQQRAENTPLGPTGVGTISGADLGLFDDYERRRKEALRKSRDSKSGGSDKKTPAEIAQESLDKLREQLQVEEALIGKSEERKRIIKSLGVEFVNQNPEIVNGLETQIQQIDEMTQREQQIKSFGETLKNSLGDAFMSIVDGSKSAGEAFRDMARIVLKQAFEMLVIKPILNSIFGGGGGGFSLFSANGNAFEQGGKVTAYANGGVVSAPTAFQHSGGLGVMGEAGPEAIMPLKRGKNGKLGVQMEGDGQQSVVINQSFNFSANGDDSVKRIIAQEAPRIANLTQKQILDQRRRGGVMKTTFA